MLSVPPDRISPVRQRANAAISEFEEMLEVAHRARPGAAKINLLRSQRCKDN